MRDSEAVMPTYVRHVDKGEFADVMLFCKSLESTSTDTDIHKLKNNLDANININGKQHLVQQMVLLL